MHELLFGIETEYAVSDLARGARRSGLAHDLVNLAHAELPHLIGSSFADLFLENGGRLYVDSGSHPEFATPECQDPREAVRFVRAGERIIERLARRLEDRGAGMPRVAVFRANVDYSGRHTTWGCHESYLCRSRFDLVAESLVPHLVSRIVFTGAGGFLSASDGITFTLSPRAAHIRLVQSNESVTERGIVHTRNEPMANANYQRVHIIFGESLCSDLALYLKVGTTALLAAMNDAGLRPCEAVTLEWPVAALQTFVADPTCRAKARLTSGRMASAVEVQRHLLHQVEAHLSAHFMPSWAPDVCRQWRAVLDRLDGAPASVCTMLDWAIKYALYANHAQQHGFDWASIRTWTRTERLEEKPSADRWYAFTKLRRQLFELDLRFGQLGDAGIFTSLDRSGALRHRIAGVGDSDIEAAVTRPPSRGRARVRGEAVGRLWGPGSSSRYACDWAWILDDDKNRRCDLGNPFEEQERWTESAPASIQA